MEPRKKIMLVDDHPLFRQGLSASVNGSAEFEICAEASDAGQALATMRLTLPDAVIVDVSLPGVNGIELIKMFKAERPSLRVLVMSMHSDTNYAIRALKAGARAYILKGESADVVLQALHDAFAGKLFMSQ